MNAFSNKKNLFISKVNQKTFNECLTALLLQSFFHGRTYTNLQVFCLFSKQWLQCIHTCLKTIKGNPNALHKRIPLELNQFKALIFGEFVGEEKNEEKLHSVYLFIFLMFCWNSISFPFCFSWWKLCWTLRARKPCKNIKEKRKWAE